MQRVSSEEVNKLRKKGSDEHEGRVCIDSLRIQKIHRAVQDIPNAPPRAPDLAQRISKTRASNPGR